MKHRHMHDLNEHRRRATRIAMLRLVTTCAKCDRRGNFRRIDVGGRVVRVCHWCRHEW